MEAGVQRLTLDDLPAWDATICDWSAVNYKDGMVTRPGNRVARISPLIPGVDLVGTVLASAEPSVVAGDQVIVHGYDLGVARHGGFSELARVPAGWIVPLPDGLTPAGGRHRDRRVHRRAVAPPARVPRAPGRPGPRPGDRGLRRRGLHGGGPAGRPGYEVVASTGKTDEAPYLAGLGAAEVIGRDELLADPERVLGPERWAGAVDCVGGPTLAAVLRTLRYGAAVAASGLTGGNTFESSVYPFIVRAASLIGVDTVLTPIAERRAVWDELATAFPSRRGRRHGPTTRWASTNSSRPSIGSWPAAPEGGRWFGRGR